MSLSNRTRSRPLGFELLEPRKMLAALGELSGTVFEDLDGDGVRDAGEPGLPGWTVELRREIVGNQLRQSLFNPAPIPGEQLGFHMAARNDRVLVGARDADLEAVNAGAAYLFDRIDGRLLQTLRKPTPAVADDYFGHGVAIVGDTIYVAAWGVDLNGSNSGLVYAFDGTTGGLQSTIQQPPPCWGDNFGYALAAVGNDLLVGARNDNAPYFRAGAAYLFDGSTGELLRTFLNPTPATGDYFGRSVAAVQGDAAHDNVLIGAPFDDAGETDAGAAYLFDSQTGDLLHTFLNPSPGTDDHFGDSVAGLGRNVVIGASLDDTKGTDAGAAYLFDGQTGRLLRTFYSPATSRGRFGASVTAVGDKVLIGAPGDDVGATDAGAAYLFDPATGELLETFSNPTPDAGDQFGFCVAAEGEEVLISAPWDDTAAADAGAVYAFGDFSEPVRVTTDADGRYSFADLPPGTYTLSRVAQNGSLQTSPPGDGTYTVCVADGTAISGLDFGNAWPGVIARHVFYNDSKWDGGSLDLNEQDSQAIAPDKQALLPGHAASFANYTNYEKGINGIMVDLVGQAKTDSLSAVDDFEFRVGNDSNPDDWSAAPEPSRIAVGEGGAASYRVTISWADHAIENQWLQVTVKATPRTGLVEPDVFYFGNAVGESGNQPGNAIVNATDEIFARNCPRGVLNPAALDDPRDFNRDGLVNGTDQIIARSHQTNPLTMLRWIDVPESGAAKAGLEIDPSTSGNPNWDSTVGRVWDTATVSADIAQQLDWLYQFSVQSRRREPHRLGPARLGPLECDWGSDS